jgi:hypothetical protein
VYVSEKRCGVVFRIMRLPQSHVMDVSGKCRKPVESEHCCNPRRIRVGNAPNVSSPSSCCNSTWETYRKSATCCLRAPSKTTAAIPRNGAGSYWVLSWSVGRPLALRATPSVAGSRLWGTASDNGLLENHKTSKGAQLDQVCSQDRRSSEVLSRRHDNSKDEG